ncbi:NUDIX domain-containing protein [Glutamicibacter sp.]|uniref:NUDIX domain-containing protein n=1 Tax=Glutamicibacter sp. TaxID=1931995 RepID=UPI003D6B2F12
MKAISYAILRRGNDVLLQLRSGTGYMDGFWSTAAAGHVEPGEAADAAAVREAREELGIRIAGPQLQPLCTVHRNQPGGTRVGACVDFFFLVRQWSGTPRLMEPGKAAELRWFPLDALPRNLVEQERLVLSRLDSGLPPILCTGSGKP